MFWLEYNSIKNKYLRKLRKRLIAIAGVKKKSIYLARL